MKVFQKTGAGSAETAVAEALQGAGSPTGIIFIAPHDKIGEVARLIRQAHPDIPSMGAEAYHVVNGEVSETKVAVLAFYEETQLAFGLIENIGKGPIRQAGQIEVACKKLGASAENSVLLEYVSGHDERLASTLAAVLAKSGIQMVGGSTFGAPADETAYVAYNGQVYGDSCVWALLKNKTGRVRVYVENIYSRQDSPAHYVTKADPDKNILYSLDGKKFSDVYCQELGVTSDQLPDNTMFNPMGRRVGNELYTASVKDYYPKDGSVLMFKRLNLNDCVYIMSLGDYEESERNMLAQIRSETAHISLIYSVDCAYRYLLYNSKDYLSTYVNNLAGLGRHFGAFTGGEQTKGQHMNQTGLYAVFE